MKLIILSLTIFLGAFANAQTFSKDFKVDLGTPYPVVDAAYKGYLTVGDGSVISVKAAGEIVTIQKFDTDGKEVSSKTYEDFPPYPKLQRIAQTTDGMFYIFESYDKKSKVFSLYSREINTDGTFESPKVMFTTSKKVTRTGRDEDGDDPISGGGGRSGREWNIGVNFGVSLSFDKSKVLVQYRLYPTEKSDAVNKDVLGFYVFDSKMESVWGREAEMPHTEKEMNNLAYTVDSKGLVYMLSYLTEKKKFEMITVSESDLNNSELDVDGDISVQRFNLIEDEAGKVTCAAYYARGFDFKVSVFGGSALSFNTDGIFMFTVDSDGAVTNEWKFEFPVDVIQKYLNERQQETLKKREEEGKAGVEDLKMIEFFAQADGSYIVIGEQRYVRNEYYITGTTNVGHFSNIIMTKISASGEVVWMKKLPKNQAAVLGDAYSQFFEGQLGIKYIAGKGVHYLMFVDNPKNEGLSENQVPEAHKNGMGGFLSAFEVNDADGSFKRHTLVDLGNIGNGQNAYQFRVTRICKADALNFMMEVYLKGKQDGMVTLELTK